MRVVVSVTGAIQIIAFVEMCLKLVAIIGPSREMTIVVRNGPGCVKCNMGAVGPRGQFHWGNFVLHVRLVLAGSVDLLLCPDDTKSVSNDTLRCGIRLQFNTTRRCSIRLYSHDKLPLSGAPTDNLLIISHSARHGAVLVVEMIIHKPTSHFQDS